MLLYYLENIYYEKENIGNIKIEWKNWDSKKQEYECHLENGEIFR